MKARELGWFTSMKQREWMTNAEKGPELWDKGNGCQKLDEIRTLLQNLLSRNLLGGSALSSESFLFVAFLRGKQSVVLASVSIYPFGGSSAKTLNRCFLPNRLQANSSLSFFCIVHTWHKGRNLLEFSKMIYLPKMCILPIQNSYFKHCDSNYLTPLKAVWKLENDF